MPSESDWEEVPTPEPELNSDRLTQAGEEVKERRGRPKGSKNKTSAKVNQTNQRRIFAGALIALFALLGMVLAWFGYEYAEKLTIEEAEEGGTYLIPIADKIGWIATAAFYLSFPAWFILKASEKFRRKVESPASPPTNERAVGGSPGPGDSSPVSFPVQGNGGSPAADQGLFIPVEASSE